MSGQGDPDELLAWAPKPASPAAVELSLPGYSGFRLVAQGGEGTVYRAHQDGLGRDVAVKVLQVDDPATLARFRRELEITVRLGRQHPHIVTVLDTGTVAGGRPCIVMEYYDLGSLHDRLRERGPLPVAEVVAAGIAVADALSFAHAQGFLHRDVKPQNILVLPTSYVLADFGIARGADAGHSASLQMVSYRHAAPQMVDGGSPAAADDLWSLGSTLFTLLEGVPPFASDNPDEDTVLPYLGRIRSAEPRPATRADVPPDLAAIISRCLRKPREERFADAGELRSALAAVRTEVGGWTPSAAPLPVDADATAMAPREHTQRFPEGPTTVPDFGPRPPAPAGPAEPAAPAEPVRPVAATPADRGTMTGRLADLTVRHDPPAAPEFGPGVRSPADFGPPAATPPTPAGGTPVASPAAPPPLAVPLAPAVPITENTWWTAGSRPPGAPGAEHAAPRHPEQAGVLPPEAVLVRFGQADPDWDLSSRKPWDPDSTGRRAHEVTAVVAPQAEPAHKRSRLPLFGAAALVAVVAGVGIGLLASRGGGDRAAAPTSSAAQATAVPTTPPPTTPPPTTSPPTTSGVPVGSDPKVAPVLNRVVDNGTSVELFWTDPTGGQVQFVVLDATREGGTPRALATVVAGATSYLVPDLDPKAERYCYQVAAFGLVNPDTVKGASTRVCAER